MLTKAGILQKFFNVSQVEDLPDKYRSWGGFDPPPGTKLHNTSFPYQRDDLPYPIPTPHDIAQVFATSDLTTGRPWGPFIRKVNGYAVKFWGSPLILQEAENHLYVERHTTVRVPKVYAAFSDDSGNPMGGEHNPGDTWYYLVMEVLDAANLMMLWSEDRISEKRKQEVALELAEQVRRLRSAVQPGPDLYYGRVHKQSVIPNLKLVLVDENMHGPYTSYDTLLSDMYKAAQISSIIGSRAPDMSPEQVKLLTCFNQTLAERGQRPTLSHCDLKLGNMMYREDEKGGFELIIIDWEYLCWLPEWVEAGSIMERCYNKKIIYDVLEEVYTPSDIEAARFMKECCDTIGYVVMQ